LALKIGLTLHLSPNRGTTSGLTHGCKPTGQSILLLLLSASELTIDIVLLGFEKLLPQLIYIGRRRRSARRFW
jgi:hypothetical protein